MNRALLLSVLMLVFSCCTMTQNIKNVFSKPEANTIKQKSDNGVLNIWIDLPDSVSSIDTGGLISTIIVQNLTDRDLLLPALVKDGFPFFLCEIVKLSQKEIFKGIPPDIDFMGYGLPEELTYLLKSKSTYKINLPIFCNEIFLDNRSTIRPGTYQIRYYLSNYYPANEKKYPMWVGYVESNEEKVVIYD